MTALEVSPTSRSRALLACPACGGALEDEPAELRCAGCAQRYPVRDGRPDLRLRREKEVELSFRVGPLADVARRRRRPKRIPLHPAGLTDVDPAAYPGHLTDGNGLTRELVSWFPRARDGQGTLLDLGCGNRRCEPVLRRTGFAYVGMDIDGPEPDVLGLGEALPFRDESFDLIFTLSVVPHTTEPVVVMREILRVLKPGAPFVGTAEFLEPCHLQSRHHVTALGLQDWLDSAGFELLQLEANDRWLGSDALLRLGFFPRLSWRVNGALGRAVDPLHKVQALRAYLRPESNRQYPVGEGFPERITGGFRFVARRPG
jgi:SAM-dependent methyltransferase